MTHRLRVRALTATLVYAFAVVVHVLVHVAGSATSLAAIGPHVVELTLALAAIAVTGWLLGATAIGAERRRKLAFVRADVRRASRTYAAGAVGAVALVAGLLFVAEGAAVDPDRGVAAFLCSLVALGLTALCLRSAGTRFVAIVGWFAGVTAPASIARAATRGEALLYRRPAPRALRSRRYRGPPLLPARS